MLLRLEFLDSILPIESVITALAVKQREQTS